MKIKKVILFFSNDLVICNCDSSKTIIARSFKLGKLIEDNE